MFLQNDYKLDVIIVILILNHNTLQLTGDTALKS